MSKSKNKTLYIRTDGGARGNPGPAGIGAVITDAKGAGVAEVSKYIGIATNNVAEYLAVIYALMEAAREKADEIVLYVDSQLVARQLKGDYRVKDADIKKFFDIALSLLRFFKKVEINEVPREENKAADALANRAINLESLL